MAETVNGNSDLALVVPIYSFDSKSFQLVKREYSSDLSKIVSRVGLANGVYTIEDADHSELDTEVRSALTDMNSENSPEKIDRIPSFLGNSHSLVNIFTALYCNGTFSHIIHNVDGSIIVGDELRDDILSADFQRSILKLKSLSPPKLLDSTHEEQLIPRKMSKPLRKLLKQIPLSSVHSASPIIVTESGDYKSVDTLKHDLKPRKPKNCWDHLAVWCVDDRFCVVETDYPVVYSDKKTSTAIHIHDNAEAFTEGEVLNVYLNSLVASVDQVVIYNIEDDRPKYISVVKTEDVMMLPELSNHENRSSLDVDELHSKITSFLEFLLEGCPQSGTYWIYKHDGDPTVSVVNLENPELYQTIPQEDQFQHTIRYKSLRMEECHKYISIINRSPYSDSNNTIQQFLLVQAIIVLYDLIERTEKKPVVHYYCNLLIDDYLQLAETQIDFCFGSHQDRSHYRSLDVVLPHLQKALDIFHTVLIISTKEMESITKTSVHPESVVSQVGEYSRIQCEVIDKIQMYLKQLILFKHQRNEYSSLLRDLNTFIHYSKCIPCTDEEEAEVNNFIGEILLFCAKDGNLTVPLTEDLSQLWNQYQMFLEERGALLNFLPDDPLYQLYLCSISFFSPSSVNYAGLLNEIGRYLQGKQLGTAILVYQKSIELFESNCDYVNTCLVLCNLAKLINQLDLTRVYTCVRWMDPHVDSILVSPCNQQLTQSTLLEFVDAQIMFVRSFVDAEKSKPGHTVSNSALDKIRFMLNYCMNALDVVSDRSRQIKVEFLVIEYNQLKKGQKQPDLELLLTYSLDVFEYLKEKDVNEAIQSIEWTAEILIQTLNQTELSYEDQICLLRSVLSELLLCAPLFVNTNCDRKIAMFAGLKKQFLSMVMKLMMLGKSQHDGETQAIIEKRCRRCIKIFNNDDFYYFFSNVEEEVAPLFDVLLKWICLLLNNPSLQF